MNTLTSLGRTTVELTRGYRPYGLKILIEEENEIESYAQVDQTHAKRNQTHRAVLSSR